MDFCEILDTKQKAFRVNMDQSVYGTFAEIGAGQEVARYFFQAGAAAGTIAKTISAYDMTVSDAVYGKESSGRYVCEGRLNKMLEKEYSQLRSRLMGKRDSNTKYFAFCNTVAARSFKTRDAGHGWMGIRFQHEAAQAPSDVVIHIKLLDNQNTLQQQAIGRMGVNLIYAVCNHLGTYQTFIASLMDNLTIERVEIDMIRVSGSAFDNIDSRLLNLELIKRNYSQAVIFDKNGIAQQPSEVLYKKNILVLRGSFRPPTLVNLDMLKKGKEAFSKDCQNEEILVLPDISTSKLLERGGIVDSEDFLARVDLLQALGHGVMISNKENFSSLNSFLQSLSKKKIAYVMGVYNLEIIFNEARYSKIDSNILLELGGLIGRGSSIYLYPAESEVDKSVLNSKNINFDKKYHYLLDFLRSSEVLKDIEDYDPKVFHIWSRTVVKMIEDNMPGWEEMVPEIVCSIVKGSKLFGYNK